MNSIAMKMTIIGVVMALTFTMSCVKAFNDEWGPANFMLILTFINYLSLYSMLQDAKDRMKKESKDG